MTKLAVLDHVSASAKVTATFFLSSASPWGGRAGCRPATRGCWQHSRQNWASLTLPGSGQGYLPWFAHKPQVKRRGSKKRGERINLEQFLDPASAPYAWQDGAEQREWLSIQHVYTEMLSGKYLICDATQKVPGTWRTARLGWHSAVPTPDGHQCLYRWYWPFAWYIATADRNDLFLFRLTPFATAVPCFPTTCSGKEGKRKLNARKDLSLWQNEFFTNSTKELSSLPLSLAKLTFLGGILGKLLGWLVFLQIHIWSLLQKKGEISSSEMQNII